MTAPSENTEDRDRRWAGEQSELRSDEDQQQTETTEEARPTFNFAANIAARWGDDLPVGMFGPT